MSAGTPGPDAATVGMRMVQLAAGAAGFLSEDAADNLRRFVRSRRTAGGGFRGRTAEGDLYYASFGLALARLIGEPPDPREHEWLRGFGNGAGLDLVHRAALIRCLTLAGTLSDPGPWRRGLAAFQSPDGAWTSTPGGAPGGPYAAFLALLALEDLGGPRDLGRTGDAVLACRSRDGGFGGAPGAPATTSVTAAAVVVLRAAGCPQPAGTLEWLAARRDPSGGWRGSAGTPVPDLLSTAVALAALRIAGQPAPDPVETDVDFIERHARDDGGFAGHPADPLADVEYTWYALLALGAIFVP